MQDFAGFTFYECGRRGWHRSSLILEQASLCQKREDYLTSSIETDAWGDGEGAVVSEDREAEATMFEGEDVDAAVAEDDALDARSLLVGLDDSPVATES